MKADSRLLTCIIMAERCMHAKCLLTSHLLTADCMTTAAVLRRASQSRANNCSHWTAPITRR